MRSGVIIQARVGSTRLPGKVLMELCDKPIVEHIYLRALESKLAAKVIVATSVSKNDDVLVQFLQKKGISYYRGSENHVLQRYFEVASEEQLDIIVRLTSDNPLFDYMDIDVMISHLIEHNLDYVTKRGIPYGANVEVFRFSALQKAYMCAENLQDQEHVTIYILNHPELFKVGYLEADMDLSGFRITVDTKDDFDKINVIYKTLYTGSPIPLHDVINFLKEQMGKIVLGTAQLGMSYGINNRTGFSEHNSILVLEAADRAGIKTLDTAQSYGESERIIGAYLDRQKKGFRIITKFTLDNDYDNLENMVREKLTLSMDNLGITSVPYFFIHHFINLKENSYIMESLLQLKASGKCKKIGISLYEPWELEYILEHHSDEFDAVQIPLNIADTRWYQYLNRIKFAGIEIHVRSIFLQGIFFKEAHEIEINNREEFIIINEKIKEMAESMQMSVYDLLVYIVYFNPDIDYVVIGMDNPEQVWALNETLIRLRKYKINYHNICEKVIETFFGTPEYILNPSKWII